METVMKKIFFLASLILLVYSVTAVNSEPKELSDHQMTDVSVDDTISDKDNKKDDTENGELKKAGHPSTNDISIIKNPVDNPTELNKAEIFRLENQAAEQRVNDQIKDSLRGIPVQE
jgi:hypothetical protein